jgi:nucleoid DNA-binding protein
MKKYAIARRLAKQLQIPTGNAADQIDRVVHGIVRDLKRGQEVRLPGLGTLKPGPTTSFRNEKSREKK